MTVPRTDRRTCTARNRFGQPCEHLAHPELGTCTQHNVDWMRVNKPTRRRYAITVEQARETKQRLGL